MQFGNLYSLVPLPPSLPNTVTGVFLNTLKFIVKDCDATTGEPDDDVGFADEYVVSEGWVNLGVVWECEATLCADLFNHGSVRFFHLAIATVNN